MATDSAGLSANAILRGGLASPPQAPTGPSRNGGFQVHQALAQAIQNPNTFSGGVSSRPSNDPSHLQATAHLAQHLDDMRSAPSSTADHIGTLRRARVDARAEAANRRQSLDDDDDDGENGSEKQLQWAEADAAHILLATGPGHATANLMNEQLKLENEWKLEQEGLDQVTASQRESEKQQLIQQFLAANPPATPVQDPDCHSLPVNGNTNTTVTTTTANKNVQSAENSTRFPQLLSMSAPTQDAAAEFLSHLKAHMNSRPGQQQREQLQQEFGQQAGEQQQPGFICTDDNPFRPPPTHNGHENANGTGHRWQPY